MAGEQATGGDYCMVEVVGGRYKGRFGYRDSDEGDAEGPGAVVYLFEAPLAEARRGLIGRTLAGEYTTIRDKHLRVLNEEQDVVARCLMDPDSITRDLIQAVAKINQFGELMKQFGGGKDFAADLARVETLLKAAP